MKQFLILFILCMLSVVVFSQTDSIAYNVDSAELLDEDSAMNVTEVPAFSEPVARRISLDSIQAIKKQEPFAYMQYIDSFFRHKKVPVEAAIKEQEREESPGLFRNPGLRMLYWLMAFAGVLWIVWRMFFGKRSLFSTNRKLEVTPAETGQESAIEITSATHIDKAIREGNYRLAVRYLYLQTLQLLGDKELINPAPQKTNYQYLQELNDQAYRQDFSTLTLRYEYAWYGDFKLSQMQFNTIYNEFKQYQQKIELL